MKLKLLSLLAIICSSANAQNTNFGLKAGYNLSELTGYQLGETSIDPSTKNTFYIGGYALINLSNNFKFQPEIIYSSQGARSSYESYTLSGDIKNFNYNYNGKVSLGYINTAYIFKYYPIKKLSIEMGPEVSFLVSSKQKDEYQYDDGQKLTESKNLDKELRSIDFLLGTGLGYDIYKGLTVNARYNFGLVDINKAGNSVRNNFFSLGLGYTFF